MLFTGSGIKNKVLEAMATGLPVIGTREAFAGIEVKNGVHGIVIDTEGFPQKILELLSNSKQREIIGRNARNLIIEKFSWETISSKYLQLYNDLL